MKQKLTEKLEIPAGISCEFSNCVLKCKKDSAELKKNFCIPGHTLKIDGNSIVLEALSGNKKDFKIIKSYIAHLKNMFVGLQNEYVYKLEVCNVHFPITLKVESDKVLISNFLGEKKPRIAKILPGVKVEAKGPKITVTSRDKDLAGQTAANLEKATKIRKRDRRVFQDGIFLTDRPGGAK
jgi:large subunit ribosomal protein L6